MNRFALGFFLWAMTHHLVYAQECLHTDQVFRCVEYVDNYDGDTVTFNIPDLHPFFAYHIAIRIRGVDTPELRSKNPCEKRLAKRAKLFVSRQLEQAYDIELRAIERGKYFRVVADIYADGINLGELLVEEQLAIPYDGGSKKEVDWCSM
jgi:endonuclease YncB( thermonuclease family)